MMRYFILLLAGLLATACTSPPADAPLPGYASLAAKLTAAIEYEMADKQLPTVGLVLVDDQVNVWAKGFGIQDADAGTSASSETVYRVASVSKLFTDIGIMQQVEQGTVNLDAPVSDYIANFHPENPYSTPITLRQLMSHRSGLLREPLVGNYFEDSEPTLTATVESTNQSTLLYEPGTKTSYSNAGIAVAGYVLEAFHQKPFADHIREAVLEPMGMHDASFAPRDDLDAMVPTAYMWTFDGREFEAPAFQMGMSPAASLYTTLPDLGRFISVLLNGGMGPNGRVVEEATLEEMWTPQLGSSRFGIGFGLSEQNGQRRVGHSGVIYGFATRLYALPEAKLGVVIVNTMDASNTVSDRLATYALDLLMAQNAGEPLPEYVVTDPIPADRQAALVGTYRHNEAWARLLQMEDELWLSQSGTMVRLKQTHPDTLIVDGRNDFGRVIMPVDDGLVIGDALYRRMAIEKPSYNIPSHWKGLMGAYGWDHNTLYIYEKAGQLHALIEWFFEYPLEEIDANTFAFPPRGLYPYEALVFERDETGRATQAELKDGAVFLRRSIGQIEVGTFKIDPVLPIDTLRATALTATPPAEEGDFLDSDLVELTSLDASFKLDIRYSTTNNFMSAVFYDEPRAFMQRPAAEALTRVNQKLHEQGYGLLIYDAYRPWYVTKMFWDATPAEQKIFVANPDNGSRHNRGCAVDLTLYDLATGEPVAMPGGYDEFSERSFPEYPGGTALQRWHRSLLREAMEAEGFSVYQHEWWHFDYTDWPRYRIQNARFADLVQ